MPWIWDASWKVAGRWRASFCISSAVREGKVSWLMGGGGRREEEGET